MMDPSSPFAPGQAVAPQPRAWAEVATRLLAAGVLVSIAIPALATFLLHLTMGAFTGESLFEMNAVAVFGGGAFTTLVVAGFGTAACRFVSGRGEDIGDAFLAYIRWAPWLALVGFIAAFLIPFFLVASGHSPLMS